MITQEVVDLIDQYAKDQTATPLRILRVPQPFAIITLLAVVIVIPGIILAVKYLDNLKGI
jgi:hypothetical protein